ncbi:hypothetical protein [Rickettsiella endosymbiont of Xylota segnis]|uniref:hypothetical protein n=1 Tax=Rickettsiella endosymbiont of Xylota segnis TaxID=3066238 RepID=UPI0030D3F205
MLQAVLKAKEQQLALKAQQRLHWWSTRRLRSLILIVPPLTGDAHLWSYNQESLACARLCGLSVIELQRKLRIYWEKPAWQQWLLYWFTPIRQQLTVWTYYQQCMTFRYWKESIQTSETINYSCPYAGEIINRFTAQLIKKMFKLEGYIDRHAMRWRKKPRLFKEEMADSECQQSSELSWDLRKALLDTVPICKMYSTRNIVKTSYEKTINVLYQYFFDYYRNTYVKILFSPPPQCMQLVLAGTSSPAILANPSPIQPSLTHTNPTIEPGISSFNFSVWVNTRQKQIKTVLQQQESTAVTQAMNLLQESFFSLTELIEPLVTPTTLLIYRMKGFTSIPTQEALQFISLLENQLVKLYRAAIPLFHPDKYHTSVAGANQALKTLCNQLTCHYQNFIEKCHKKLEDRKKDIFKIESQRQANEKRFPTKQLSWAEMWEEIENIKKGIKAFDEKMEKTDAKLKNHEARIQALFRKRRAEKFNQCHRLFKLRIRRLSVLKEELEEEKSSVIFNK